MKIFRLLLNKYLLATAAFAVWMIFFDQNDLQSKRDRSAKLKTTNDAIRYYNEEIGRMEAALQARRTSPAELERIAREDYRMKRDGEDIYLLADEPVSAR